MHEYAHVHVLRARRQMILDYDRVLIFLSRILSLSLVFRLFLLLFLCFLSPSLSLLSLPPSLSLHAGKSCVIDSLLGKPYDPNSESTRGADVSRCTVDTTNVKAWAAQKAEEAGGQLEQVK